MPRDRSLIVDGEDVVKQLHEVLDRTGSLADRLRGGEWRPLGEADPQCDQHGIGGSDLGPVMAYEALATSSIATDDVPLRVQRRRHRFRRGHLGDLSEETLFIVSSKTFTTLETMTNARTARDWVSTASAGTRRRPRALRRRVDQRRRGARSSIGHRQHVRVLGLGRRPLLDGLRDRVDDDRDRASSGSRRCRWVPRRRRALPRDPDREQPARVDGAKLAVWYGDFGAATVAVLPYDQYLKDSRRTPAADAWSRTAST